MTSFSNKKQLKFIITLGTGTFGESGDNQIILQGFRAVVDADKAGGQQMGSLRARIYGVSQKNMNSIATFNWKIGLYLPNTIEIYAIDGEVESLVFGGNMINAWADYDSLPDVYLSIQARSGYVQAITPIVPTSFKGSIDVASVMAQLATTAGLSFENNGVNIQLTDIYLANTALEQIKDLAQMANIDFYLDDKTLAICPKNVPRGTLIASISPQSGLVGYPKFDGYGITFRSLFNPSVVFGGRVKIESDVIQAQGQWFVSSIHHMLESEKPGGSWFSTVRALPNEFALSL